MFDTMIHSSSRLRLCPLLTAAFTAFLPAFGSFGTGIQVTEPKCEYRGNPLGIETPQPRFSWVIQSPRRGERQTAYEILAASSGPELDGGEHDLWDSGKVISGDSVGIVYNGKPLRSGQTVYWKVRIWDRDGKTSGFSRPAWFETALLTPAAWQAQWIQSPNHVRGAEADAFDDHPAPLLRKSFQLAKPVKRARAYVSGLGYFELRLNGERIGNDVLNPGWTSYAKRVLYSTYDVTAQLRRGNNAVGLMLGNGWFNPLPLAMWGHLKPGDALLTGEPRAILQLVIEFTDGSTQTLCTDETWRATNGPVMRNSVYLGEFYDARREQPGWDRAGFDDSQWKPVELAREPRLGLLKAQDAPPIRVTRILKPVKLTESGPGVFIFDFGQNFAGWSRLHVEGPRGTCVRLRSGELLDPDGRLNGLTAVAGQIKAGGKDYVYDGIGRPRTAFQLDEYTLKGGGPETYTPRFTFHGFRYVEVTGFPGRPTLAALEGLALNADVAPAGSFECSNDLINRIQHAVIWTELANLFSVQSDCPAREKFGYGGDLAVTSEMGMLNFDMARFYAKVAQDFVDDQRANGGFTETAPFVGLADQNLGDPANAADLGQGAGPVDWGVAEPLLAWQLFQYYGDRKTMTENYDAIKRWIELLHAKATDNRLDNGISDHESLAPKPRALTGTGAYYQNVKLFAQIAHATGHDQDAAAAEALAEQIQTAFNREFLRRGTGVYDSGSQACQALALYFGLVPPEEKDRALASLVRDVTETHQDHLTTGIFGTKYMLNALTDLGRADVAYAVVNQRSFPGWGFMLENGATTLWEHWAFSDNIYSHDHPMFGSVSEWFYKALAGIKPAPEAVGFDRIILAPQPVGDLKWAKAGYDSVRGKILSEWRTSGNKFYLHARIPVGATATVVLPAKAGAAILESGREISHWPEIQLNTRLAKAGVLTVPAGEYFFETAKP